MIEHVFMDRLGITEAQFTEVAAFFGIMSFKTGRAVFEERAKLYGLSTTELLAIRRKAMDTFILNSQYLDRQARETNFVDETYVDDDGISVFNYERTTRATIHAIETRNLKEAAGMAGYGVEGMEVLVEIFERRLAYLAAEAIKLNPTFNALDIMRNFPDPDHFCEWFERAMVHLDEDHASAEAEVDEDSSEF